MDGSLSSSDLVPSPPVSDQLPSALWKNASSRAAAFALPPIAWNSPATLCCTIHVYCALVPSANPLNEAGLDGAQLPSSLRLLM